jgi:hypothetical protein
MIHPLCNAQKSSISTTVRDNINYFVNDIEIMGLKDAATVFVQIIIEWH